MSTTHSTQAVGETPLCSTRAAVLLAIATGLLYFLAFPGIDLWPLSFVTWVPLLLAMRGRSVKHVTLLFWISGVTMTFVGFYWALNMLQVFSGFSTPVCILLMLLMAAYQGGRIALFGWLFARALSRGWWRGPSYALAFAASELCFPLIFPWYFGATVHQVPLLTQLADLGSPIAVGLLLCSVNYAASELLAARLRGNPMPWRLAAAQLPLVAIALGYGAFRLDQVDTATASARKGTVGVVQANLGLMEKRNDRREGLRRHLALSKQLEDQTALDLIVWTETSVAGGVPEENAGRVYKELLGSELHTPTLFGAALFRKVDDARRYTVFNTALINDRSGNIVGRYDKHVLLPFGEYLPLGNTFPVLYEWSPNTGKFSPGESLEPLPAGDLKISVHICYEDVLPSVINRMMRAAPADLIVNLTNDAWYGDTTQPWIHMALATFRSIEHRRYLVRSTNSGVSGFVDAAGRVVRHTGVFEQTAMAQEVAYLKLGPTPYQIWGDTPWWLCTLLIAVATVVPRRRLLPHLPDQREGSRTGIGVEGEVQVAERAGDSAR